MLPVLLENVIANLLVRPAHDAIFLTAIANADMSISMLSDEVNLSQATITSIINCLESCVRSASSSLNTRKRDTLNIGT
jgi:hypothetical protein